MQKKAFFCGIRTYFVNTSNVVSTRSLIFDVAQSFGRRHEDKTADQSTAILRSQNMDLIRLLFWLPSCSDMRMVDAGAVESGPFGRGVAFEQNKRRISNFEDMSK